MAVFRIDKTRDYTVMSNCHLRDKRLTLKAKGLLSQMLSLPEDWDYTLTGLSLINRESKDAIRTAVNELEQAGYIERRQTTDEHGKFGGNEYVIHEKPVQQETQDNTPSEPSLDNPTTEPSLENPTTEPLSHYPSSENPMTGKPTPEITSSGNPTQLNKYIQNKEKQITDLSSTDSFFPSAQRESGASAPAMETDGRKERKAIREQIDYDFLVNPYNRSQLDELVELMVEVQMNRSPMVKIGRDTEYPTGYVRERFGQITSEHIEKILDGIRENTTRVWNTKAYLMAALFNSVSTIDNHYAMLVNHDFHGNV